MKNLQILEECFKEGMINKDFESFKKTHPTLLKVVLRAMQRATETNTLLCKLEGSDGVSGAAVASEGEGEANTCAGRAVCPKCGKNFYAVTKLWNHLDRCSG